MKFHEAYKIMCEDPTARFTSSYSTSEYRVEDGVLFSGKQKSTVYVSHLANQEWTQVFPKKLWWRRMIKGDGLICDDLALASLQGEIHGGMGRLLGIRSLGIYGRTRVGEEMRTSQVQP